MDEEEVPQARRERKRRRLNDDLQGDTILDEGEDQVDSDEAIDEIPSRTKRNRKSVISSDKLAETRAAVEKTGVIYISRIPPRLNPTKIRQLLSPFGSPVLRIFLAPESTVDYNRRVKAGGSKKKHYIEGWIEFEDKKVAKRVVEMLNAQRIGVKKSDFLYDDLWCLRYLPKFKWHHLTEQIAYQNASRKEKMRNEIAQEKRENQAFIAKAEKSKMIESIQKRREEKGEMEHAKQSPVQRHIPQKRVLESQKKDVRPSVLHKAFD